MKKGEEEEEGDNGKRIIQLARALFIFGMHTE